jgi:hypothetical protein
MSKFWYCLDHHRVEPTEGCPAMQRLGPYTSEEEASRALEKVQERNQEWDKDDAWGDDKLED